MPYTVKQLDQEPIVVVTYLQPLDMEQDIPKALNAINSTVETIPGTVYIISDVRDLNLSFSDLTIGMAGAAKMLSQRCVYVTVSSSELVKLVTAGMKSEHYGKHEVPIFASLEEAAAYARRMGAAK